MSGQSNEHTYALGRSQSEEQRLQRQAALAEPFTRQLFEAAGIGVGMKVLDLGSGPGDVAFLAAQMVGPTGSVVGVEINPHSVETARHRAQAAGYTNVTFIAGDIRDVPLDHDFGAVVGRAILVHLRDPTAILRQLATHLRPNGVAAFQEPTYEVSGMTYPPSRLNEQVTRWITQGLAYGGSELAMGMKLYQVLLDAGFAAPNLVVHARMGGDREHIEATTTNQVGQVRSLLPLLVEGGYATEEEVGIETLAARYRDEVLAQGSVLRAFLVMCGWARKA